MDTNLVAEIARQIANQTIGEHLLYHLVLMAVAFLAVAASAFFGAYFKTREQTLRRKQILPTSRANKRRCAPNLPKPCNSLPIRISFS